MYFQRVLPSRFISKVFLKILSSFSLNGEVKLGQVKQKKTTKHFEYLEAAIIWHISFLIKTLIYRRFFCEFMGYLNANVIFKSYVRGLCWVLSSATREKKSFLHWDEFFRLFCF